MNTQRLVYSFERGVSAPFRALVSVAQILMGQRERESLFFYVAPLVVLAFASTGGLSFLSSLFIAGLFVVAVLVQNANQAELPYTAADVTARAVGWGALYVIVALVAHLSVDYSIAFGYGLAADFIQTISLKLV